MKKTASIPTIDEKEIDVSVNFDDVMRKLLTAKPKPRAIVKKAKAKPKTNGGST